MSSITDKKRLLTRAEFFTPARALFVLYILMIPWLKLEIMPRFSVAEPIFVAIIFILFVQNWSGSRALSASSVPTTKYFFVISFWATAILLSGYGAAYESAFLFESAGMVYLAFLSLLAIVIAAESEMSFDEVMRWVKVSVCMVVAVGVCGILYKTIAGGPTLFFYSNAGKLISTFVAPNQLASFLILFFPLILEEVLRNGSWTRKFFFVVVLLGMTACVLGSGSRTAVAAVIFGTGLYGLIYMLRMNFKVLVLGAAAVVAGCFGIPLLIAQNWVGQRALSVLSIETIQNGLTDIWRLQNWSTGIEIFLQNPLVGFGLGNVHIINQYEIHNTYISVLAEMGIVGGIATALLLGYLLICLLQNLRISSWLHDERLGSLSRGLFVGVSMFLVFATQHQMLRNRYFWLVIGLVVALNVLLKLRYRTERVDSKATV